MSIGLKRSDYFKGGEANPNDASQVTHGVDCQKAPHKIAGGYLHREDDDSPYDVDGVAYCGRCHTVMS